MCRCKQKDKGDGGNEDPDYPVAAKILVGAPSENRKYRRHGQPAACIEHLASAAKKTDIEGNHDARQGNAMRRVMRLQQ